MAAEKRNYGVFRITNHTPNAKRRTYYVVSSMTDPSQLMSRIRGMKTSSTANGGAKAIANDMASKGKDYRDDFSIAKIRSGMTKRDATIYRNSLKAGSKKAYNTPRE